MELIVEDMGTKTRLHAKGPHIHPCEKGFRTCEGCRVDLPVSKRFVEKLIDRDASGVFQFIDERLCDPTFNESPKNVIRRFCPDLSCFKVLDFGCGIGQLSPFFFELGARKVILTDIEDDLIDLARIYLEDRGYAAQCEFYRIEENDALAMIDNESLDLIVASEVFEHILPQYRQNALRTLYGKLKPGGTIVITAPNRFNPKDTHTTGLWFAAWFPARIGAWYAKKFSSWHWKNRSTEGLLRLGLRQYSYFEARKVLNPLGARELCVEFPLTRPPSSYRSVKGRLFQSAQRFAYVTVLKHLGPWEAWQASLEIAWAKPE